MSKKKPGLLRLAAGAALMSALYCLLIFTVSFRVYLNVFAAVLIIMLGCVVTFRPEDLREFLRQVALSHMAAFALGGMGMAIFYFTNITDVLGNIVGVTITHFSFKILLAATCTSYIIIKLTSSWFRRHVKRKQTFYPVKIYYGEHDASITALLDTGNSLHDPISDAPVIIAEFHAVKNVLPDALKLVFYENKENDLGLLLDLISGCGLNDRLRVIPFESLGKQNGILLGFRPDKVEVLAESSPTSHQHVVIGIYNCRLSRDNAYQGLLNAELV